MAVPTRTKVAPSSMATSKSFVMPMLRTFIDTLSMFIGPFFSAVTKANAPQIASAMMSNTVVSVTGTITCPKCNALLQEAAKFCRYCGQNVEQQMGNIQPPLPNANVGTPVNKAAIDAKLLAGTEDQAVSYLVKKEINLDPNNKGKTLPVIEKKKTLMTLICME